MKGWLLIGTLILAAAGYSAVDAVAQVDTTPNLESELRRGMDAAGACPSTSAAQDYAKCIFAISARNQQTVVDYKPFDTGLFFKAWIAMDLLGNSGTPADTDLAMQSVAAARHQAASMYTVFLADQRKVGATDEQMIAASGLSKSMLESRLASWASQPPAP
jgi:hypothetical protein